ncbi:hypothetical protein Tco_0728567 [Tanacetum coccineum]|uniref:Uncharacterized protein n=1 Tax=Tanacetum coccineum TaxID=301880 RepID=A0ABQ4YMM7_9ASTR
MQRLSLLGKKVEATLKSAWTEKDQIDNLLKERRLMRSLEKFVENAEFDESNANVLEIFYTSAGNPIKEILLKLNLPDHRSILTDSKMNKKVASVHEEKVLEEPNSTKVEIKQEGNKESTRKRPGRRLKMKEIKKSRMQKADSDLEEEEHLKTFLKLVPDEE